MAKAEGKIFELLSPEFIRTDYLETVNFNESDQIIEIKTDEFSAVCPFSGLPDIAEIIIEYKPKTCIIELKSLKYYFTSFRMVGIYQEAVTERIYKDLTKVLGTTTKVTTIYNRRGGMDVTCVKGII